jgi:hypothetical protein
VRIVWVYGDFSATLYLARCLVGSGSDAHNTDTIEILCSCIFFLASGSHNSSVGIVTRLRARQFGVRWQEIYLLSTSSRLDLGSTSNLSFNRYSGSFPWVKRPGRDVDHSLLSSGEVKTEWSYTLFPPYMTRIGAHLPWLYHSSTITSIKGR